MKYPFEKQKDLKDCGVCCLLMLTRYYGGDVSKEYLREITNTTKEGVSAYDLIEGAKNLGFDSYGVNGDIKELKIENTPCIAHVIYKKRYPHFIVIYKTNKRKRFLLVADPNDNHIKKLSYEEFNKISTKNYIILTPRKKIMFTEKNDCLKKLILNTVITNRKHLIKIIILSIIISIVQIILSFDFKILTEYVISYNTTYNLLLISLLFISFIFIKELSNYNRNRLMNTINHEFDKSLFLNVYNHLLSLPYLYYKNRTTGEIVSRMDDLISIRDVISKFVVTTVIDLFLLISSLICLFILNAALFIIVIVSLFLLFLFMILFNNSLENRINKTKQYGSKLNSYLVETIGGIETIRNQNIVSYIKKKFLLKYCIYNKNSYKYNNLFINLDFIKNIIIGMSNLLLLIIGSYLVTSHNIDVTLLITFITITSYVYTPVENITNLLLSLKDAKISFNRIHELFEIEEEKDNSFKDKNDFLTGDIKLDDLKYSYNNRDIFLKNVNLNIENTSKTLIYGKSGSGKSTIAKIMAGILKIPNKYLYYNNRDINKYSSNTIRKDICYISNNETLFTDSIYNNIVLDKELSDKDFFEVSKLCMVDEFVDLKPLAYDTLIEENGFNLSGGEKQRILLARALLKDANVYILDEALNQVDIKRERKILNDIFNKYPNKTFIYISHRFHNEDLFDKKYRIEDGISYEEFI